MRLLDRLTWPVAWLLVATLGLAPYRPPHVWEKLQLLASGGLSRPIDLFDLALHGTPWLLVALKAVRELRRGRRAAG